VTGPLTPVRKHRSRRAWTACLGFAAALLIGCGSEGGPHLAAVDAGKLRAELGAAEAASARGDRAATLDALGRFKVRLERLQASNRLAPDDARALRIGVSQALAAAERQLEPAAPPAATATAAAPPAPSPTAVPTEPPKTPKKPTPRPHPKHHDKHEKGKKGSE
jgi:cell division septation protein DedD